MELDLRQCAVIETVPDRMDDEPVIKGTRPRPQGVLVNREQGIEWLIANHGGITREQIEAVFLFQDQSVRFPHAVA